MNDSQSAADSGGQPIDPLIDYMTNDGGQAARGAAVTTRLSDVQPERVTWLWRDHFPLGKVAMLDGDPGVGKSTVSLDIGARVSTGREMPDGSPGISGATLVLSAEDGLADTIRPRIDAAGGDPAAFIAMTGWESASGTIHPVSIPRDIDLVEQLVIDEGVSLVILDVLVAYLSGEVNSHNDQQIRRALAPVAEMADRTGCAVLALRHLNKGGSSSPIYRGGGSIGIAGAARATFMCGQDPEQESRAILAAVKCNLSIKPPSLAYEVVEVGSGSTRVRWLGETTRQAWELVAADRDDERSERDEAGQWLFGYLADHGGEAPAAEVIKHGKADGHALRTLQRARKRAGVSTVKASFGGGWIWQLGEVVPGQVIDIRAGRRRHEDAEDDRPQE